MSDYADMQVALRRGNEQFDPLGAMQCVNPSCDGTVSAGATGVVCSDCGGRGLSF